jgi:hypothetical protein
MPTPSPTRRWSFSLIVGVTALIITYVMQRRTFRAPSPDLLMEWENEADQLTFEQADADHGGGTAGSRTPSSPAPATGAVSADSGTPTVARITETDQVDDSDSTRKMLSAKVFALLVPLVYLGLIVYLLLGKFTSLVPPLRGGDAAAIVGGLAAVLLFAASASNDKRNFLESTSEHVVDGLVFAFKAMGIVLPIAGFFFIGNGDFSGAILGLPEDAKGPAFLFDLINAAQSHFAPNPFVISFGVLLIGLNAGLEGSGFTGLPLTGSLAGALGLCIATSSGLGRAFTAIGSFFGSTAIRTSTRPPAARPTSLSERPDGFPTAAGSSPCWCAKLVASARFRPQR